MSRFRSSDCVAKKGIAPRTLTQDTSLQCFLSRAARRSLSIEPHFTARQGGLRANFSAAWAAALGKRGLLILIIAIALPQEVALAQGVLTNGLSHVGVIQVGGSDSWTLAATANDAITISVGEMAGSGADPYFNPWVQLRGPDGTLLGSDWGSNAAQLSERVSLTGTYTILVSNLQSGYAQSGPGSYSLTVARTPGPYTVSPGDEGGPVTNGANHAGVITVGDLDPWTFEAAYNDNITVSLGEVPGSGPDPNFGPRIRLLAWISTEQKSANDRGLLEA